jgi:stalled ribosome rescue protein Dom34
MKQRTERQYAGVCLDNTIAVIIAQDHENDNNEYTIHSKIDADKSNSSGSEHTMNNAKHADDIKYFKSISAALHSYDEVLLFGTGKAQEQFHNFLKEDAQFNNKKITVDSADNLTDPQMIAKVRDFFKSHQS